MPEPEATGDAPGTERDWRAEARAAKALARRLPDQVRSIIWRAKRWDLRRELAQEIIDEVEALGLRRGLLRTAAARDPLGADFTYLRAIDERALFREMCRPERLRHLHRRVDAVLRDAHRVRVNPTWPTEIPPEPADITPARTGRAWELRGDLGLQTSSYLGEAPDEFWFAVARRLTRGPDVFNEGDLVLAREESQYRAQRVLILDPRGGALARAAASLDLVGELQVTEVGPEFGPTALPTVRPNRASLPMRLQDAAVWVVPAPCTSGAANQVQAYRTLPGATEGFPPDDPDLRVVRYRRGNEVFESPWPGCLGPKRWRRAVAAILRAVVVPALLPGGSAVLYLPQGLRVYARATARKHGRHGYEPMPELLPPLLEALPSLGLRVEETYDVEELDPVAQPFVGTGRCPSIVVVARKVT